MTFGSATTLEDHFKRYRKSKSPRDLAPIFKGLAPQLMQAARRAGLDEQGAEDVVQETFLGFIEAEERFDADGRIVPWVQGIALRQIKAERRRRARRQMLFKSGELSTSTLEESADGDTGPLALREFKGSVEKAMGGLSECNRLVVSAALFDGMSIEEMSSKFDLSRSAVSVRLHRGLRQLRERLGERQSLGLLALCIPKTGEALPYGSKAGTLVAGAGILAAVAATTALVVSSPSHQGAHADHGLERHQVSALDSGDRIESVGQLAGRTMARAPGSVPKTTARTSGDTGAFAGDDQQATLGVAAQAAAVTGSIVLDQGGIGPAGAEVFALQTAPDLVLPTAPLEPLATTGAEGEFSFTTDRLPNDATPLLMVRAGTEIGWVEASADDLARGELPPIVMGPELRIAATIVDESGAPLEGVQLAAFTMVPRFTAAMGAVADEFGFVPTEVYRHLFGAVTDENGRATIKGLVGANTPELMCVVSAKRPGYARVSSGYILDGTDQLDINFAMPSVESLSLDGQIVDASGAPVDGVEVRFRVRGDAPQSDDVFAVTGLDGRWAVPTKWLDEFPLMLGFSHPDFGDDDWFVEQAAHLDGAPQTIVLQRRVPLGGVVRDALGSPVAGAEVTVATIRSLDTVSTDIDGAFAFEGLVRERRTLVVSTADSDGMVRSQCIELAADESELSIVMPAFDGVAPQVEVELESDAYWERVSLVAHRVSGTVERLEPTFVGGNRAAFEQVPAGEWFVCGVVDSGESVIERVSLRVDVQAAEASDPITAVVKPVNCGELECVVSLAELCSEHANVASECKVIARLKDAPELPSWVFEGGLAPWTELYQPCWADTPAILDGLVPGTWQVFATGEGWATSPIEVEVYGDLRARVDLTPVPSGRVQLQLPAIARSSLLRFEVRPGTGAPASPDDWHQSDDWHLVGIPSLMVGVAETIEIQLPPGDWQWRAWLDANTNDKPFLGVAPRTHGTVTVEADGKTTIAPLDGAVRRR